MCDDSSMQKQLSFQVNNCLQNFEESLINLKGIKWELKLVKFSYPIWFYQGLSEKVENCFEYFENEVELRVTSIDTTIDSFIDDFHFKLDKFKKHGTLV